MERCFEERMQEKLDQLRDASDPQPIRSDGAGSLDLGPRDLLRDEENPDMLVPPATDFGLMPNLRFSFSDTHMTLKSGGWSREITERELPVDKTLAIVNMNLSPGVREMHSHLQSEWGYVLQGGARVTAVDERGRTFIADCGPGEGWISVLNLSDEFLSHVKKESCPIVRYPGYAFPPAKGTPQNVRYFKDFDYEIKRPCRAAKEH